MKTSIKLNLKAKKLKTLSKEHAQQVAGATGDYVQPQMAAAYAVWPTLINC